jgi:4-hydroxybenzoate polyprenyltransferase
MNDIRQDNLIFKIFPIFTHPYILIMRLDRPIGYILLFYPICFSIFAFSDFNLKIVSLLIIFLIGSIVMRSAGCIINDLLDRDIDNKVRRTQNRPLVSNSLSIKNSIILLIVLLSIGLIVLIQLNLPSIILALSYCSFSISIPISQKVFLSSPICSSFYL